jgi:uncharacterized coiled-coil protein SlyX
MMEILPIIISFGALALNAATLLIGYGVLKGTVAALDQRVKTLEIEINALTEVRVHIGEIKTALVYMTKKLDSLGETAPARARSRRGEP